MLLIPSSNTQNILTLFPFLNWQVFFITIKDKTYCSVMCWIHMQNFWASHNGLRTGLLVVQETRTVEQTLQIPPMQDAEMGKTTTPPHISQEIITRDAIHVPLLIHWGVFYAVTAVPWPFTSFAADNRPCNIPGMCITSTLGCPWQQRQLRISEGAWTIAFCPVDFISARFKCLWFRCQQLSK